MQHTAPAQNKQVTSAGGRSPKGSSSQPLFQTRQQAQEERWRKQRQEAAKGGVVAKLQEFQNEQASVNEIGENGLRYKLVERKITSSNKERY